LRALPAERFDLGLWKMTRVGLDCHVRLLGHDYSVPHERVGERVDVRYTPSLVEVFYKGERIASHARLHGEVLVSTTVAHLPQAQQAYGKWTDETLLAWAETYGAAVREVSQRILALYAIPKFGFRAVEGVVRLGKTYGASALNAACAYALAQFSTPPRRAVLLGLLKNPPPLQKRTGPSLGEHELVRGADYYSSLH
jgi:transposase